MGAASAGIALVYTQNNNSFQVSTPGHLIFRPKPLYNPSLLGGIHLIFAASCAITRNIFLPKVVPSKPSM